MIQPGPSAARFLPNSLPETAKRRREASNGPGRTAAVLRHVQTTPSVPRFRAHGQARARPTVIWQELRNDWGRYRPADLPTGHEQHRRPFDRSSRRGRPLQAFAR